jgi:hypothetical protein
MTLIEEMEKRLPIPAYPSKELCQVFQQQGKDIKSDTELEIEKVFDSGDSGGIMCAIAQDKGEVYVVSLTHLRIKSDHPLFRKISDYQRKRIRKLSRQRQGF